MAEIPAKPQPTRDAIYAAYEAAQETGYRDHLGASLIGGECKRAIWYSFRWTTKASFAGRLLRLFETGQLAEARFVANLRAVGVEIHDINADTGKQWEVRDESGHFGGSMDAVGVGFLEAPKTWHVVEFKTHGAKSFAKLTAEGVEKSKPLHFAQMQVYMHLAGLERAFYLAVNKDTDDLYSERVSYDVTAALRLIAKAHSIIAAEQPPSRLSDDPCFFACKFCDHASACRGERLPEAHCRSCLHATPGDGGTWVCERDNKHLSRADQRLGCPAHLYIPGLVAGEQIDANPTIGWVKYRMADGTVFTDGIPF